MAKINNYPIHVALIMDGNGRWANKQGKPRNKGHEKGVEALGEVIKSGIEFKLKSMTFFAFSTENWSRPKEEIDFLMNSLHKYIEKNKNKMNDDDVKVKVIGDKTKLNQQLQDSLNDVEAKTVNNQGLLVNFAINYGSRQEIFKACTSLANKVQDGKLNAKDITQEMFESELNSFPVVNIDLLIRTSGEERISNFLLYQIAYSELYFTGTYWPDFKREHLETALKEFASRTRRFGGL